MMANIRILVTGAIMAGAVTVGIGFGRAEEDPLPPVAGDAIWTLVGNTLIYDQPDHFGETVAVYLRPDATGLKSARNSRGAGNAEPIRWATMSDQSLCIADFSSKLHAGDCGSLSVYGESAAFTMTGKPPLSGKILQGDAWTLDPTTPTQTRLTGAEAIEALIGNTIVFIPLGGGREYGAYHVLPDGVLRRGVESLDDGGVPEFIHWVPQPTEKWSFREEDGSFCIGNAEPARPSQVARPDYCAVISIAGDTVILRDRRNHIASYGKLLPGDTRSLQPSALTSARAMEDRLIGHTLEIMRLDGQKGSLYFQSRGAGRGKRQSEEVQPFRWLLRTDGSLCVADDDAKFSEQNCADLSIVGSTVTLTIPGKQTISGRILRGNARKL